MAQQNAEASSSRSARFEAMSPDDDDELREHGTKPGWSVDENGEVVKVPAFLNKLYSMVSDPTTDELIYWSASGDSFFVPNHEQFGKQLLPRFFKHSNFSSFVRQLNMYGFHKVPHLQTGVLQNEQPSELWEFVNPFFKRGQPQLLARVSRKNHRPNPIQPPIGAQSAAHLYGSGQPVHLITDGSVEGDASNMLIGPTGQVLDFGALTAGIAQIQQTQASIGAELKSLKGSNEMLWREAMQQREKSMEHQETIGLIVGFLERLFGTEGEGLKGLKEAMRRGGIARQDADAESTPRKRKRLGVERLIDDGTGSGEEAKLVEIPSRPRTRARVNSTGRSSANDAPTSQRFTAVPESEPPSASNSTTLATPVNQNYVQAHISPFSDNQDQTDPTLRATDANALARFYGNHQIPSQGPLSPATAALVANLDPSLLQTTIGSLLQSPAAAQMFLNSLTSSTQGQALQTPQKSSAPSYFAPQNPSDPTMALLSPLPNQDGLRQHSSDLQQTYENAAGMQTNVDELQASIDSLLRSMGLELPNGNAGGDANGDGQAANGTVKPGSNGAADVATSNGTDPVDPEFDMDDFFAHLESQGGMPATES